MRTIVFIILIAEIFAILFLLCLIKAVRTLDEEKRFKNTFGACFYFGMEIFLWFLFFLILFNNMN